MGSLGSKLLQFYSRCEAELELNYRKNVDITPFTFKQKVQIESEHFPIFPKNFMEIKP